MNKKRNFKGTIIPMAVALIAAIVPLCALSVDVGYFGVLRGNLEKAVEASAVAGAQEYFRSRADAGKAVNAGARVFKMNISDDTMSGNYYSSTGAGQPSSLTYSKTFTQADGLNNFYREAPVNFKITTNLDRGKVSVTAEIVPKPFFAQFLASAATIKVTREAELPPMDVVFVIDLSGSMRFATFSTYIGSAYRQVVGMSGLGTLYSDVVLFQSEDQLFGTNSMITANGYVTTIASITDVIVNSPGFDIPSNATYTTGMTVYTNDPDRGAIVNAAMAVGLYRTALTGYRVSELAGLPIANEDKGLAQSYANNRSLDSNVITPYFNMLAPYIEPVSSASYGVRAFIDTVRTYGTAALKIGLCSFSSSSSSTNTAYTVNTAEYEGNNLSKSIRTTFPYIELVSPVDFNTVTQKITIMSSGGNGTAILPITTFGFPDGGTNINAGLDNGKLILDRSDRPSSEKIIILFTDGEPTSHSFTQLGQKVKSLTDAGIKVYSIVLTLAIAQSVIDQFEYQVESVGKAEPVLFINDPANLKDAFLQIADELGLKLVS